MRELVIGREEAHQRLDKYLQKYFENASAGFLYKMMRKKNIVRNGKKVQGKEILCEGDVIRVFFSDETFAAMRGGERALGLYEKLAELEDKDVDVIYEDADILAVNKPAGILSQKAKDTDISMNEEILAWLIHRGKLTPENFALFHPSVANRLGRNTTLRREDSAGPAGALTAASGSELKKDLPLYRGGGGRLRRTSRGIPVEGRAEKSGGGARRTAARRKICGDSV